LSLDLCKHALSKRPIAHFRGGHLARKVRKGVDEVCAADDADQLTAAHDGKPVDAMSFHFMHDVFERRVLAHRARVEGHHLLDLAAVGVDIVGRQPARPEHQFQPARSATLGTRFRPSQEVSFGGQSRPGGRWCQRPGGR
jgi:hypothetical protein